MCFLRLGSLKVPLVWVLFQCFEGAMAYIGISDWKERLVGYGCDGASANMAAGGLRGHLEQAVP